MSDALGLPVVDQRTATAYVRVLLRSYDPGLPSRDFETEGQRGAVLESTETGPRNPTVLSRLRT